MVEPCTRLRHLALRVGLEGRHPVHVDIAVLDVALDFVSRHTVAEVLHRFQDLPSAKVLCGASFDRAAPLALGVPVAVVRRAGLHALCEAEERLGDAY